MLRKFLIFETIIIKLLTTWQITLTISTKQQDTKL